MKSYVINLARDSERLAKVTAAFNTEGLAFERFPAVDGREPLHPRIAHYFTDWPLTAGELGCYASHLSVWRKMLVDEHWDDYCALICEDDITLAPGFLNLLDRILDRAPPGWDLIRLSSPTSRAVHRVRRVTEAYSLVRYTRLPTSAGGYLLTRDAAQKLLAPMVRKLPVDADFSRPWKFNLDVYGVLPPPVRQSDWGVPFAQRSSSIEGAGEARVSRRPRGLKGLPARLLADHHIPRLRYHLKTIGPLGLIGARLRHTWATLAPRA